MLKRAVSTVVTTATRRPTAVAASATLPLRHLSTAPAQSTSSQPQPQPSPPPSSRAGPGSRLSSPPPADIAAHLSSFLAPLGCELEQGIAVRALTHKSVGETVNTGHNEKLAFMGRRILRLHLTLHLNTALAPFPDLLNHYVTQESIDLLLDTRELGAGAGAALQLERALRWREVRGPDGRPTGLFKSRGCALEAVVGAVYLTHGIAASQKLFDASVLPNMSLPETLSMALKGERRGQVKPKEEAEAPLQRTAAA